MYRQSLAGAICAAALFSSAPALAADSMAMAAHVYAIGAQNGSGESGTVTLMPMGEKTRVVIALVGTPTGVAQPVHIHDGSCAKLDPKPAYPLTTLMDGVSSTVVDAPIAKLTGGGFAVNAHKSTTDIPSYVACGDLK